MKNTILLFFLLFHIANFSPVQAKPISLIYDTEIYDVIKDISYPIFESAGLNPKDIELYIINDENINAFVSGGQKMFINTGLITLNMDPNGLIGVIAHETGHITGGHLIKISQELTKIGKSIMVANVIGIVASILSSNPEIAQSTILSSSHIAQRSFLSYSRIHEESADSSAVIYLEKNKTSVKGLIDFFKVLQDKERLSYDMKKIDPYMLTHPVSKSRLDFFKEYYKTSKYSNEETDAKLKKRFERIVTKIKIFLSAKPKSLLSKYKGNEDIDLYAKAIIYHKSGLANQAISYIDKLIKRNPNDAYLLELKGEILYKSRQGKEASYYYYLASQKLKHSHLIKNILASILIALDSKNYKKIIDIIPKSELNINDYDLTTLDFAENILIRSIGQEPTAEAWYNLALLNGKKEEIGLFKLYMAEHFSLRGNYVKAQSNLQESIKILKKKQGSGHYLIKAIDLQYYLDHKLKDEKKKNRKKRLID